MTASETERTAEKAPEPAAARPLPLLPRDRLLDPFPWYREQRALAPIQYDQESDFWSVFRYADVEHVLSEHSLFSSQFRRLSQSRAMGDDESDRPFVASIVSTDPPRHRHLRSLVTQAFTPRSVAEMAPRIEEIVRDLLVQVEPAGSMELMGDLASPLPITVIAEMLGVPVADRDQFKQWSHDLVTLGEGQTIEEQTAGSRTASREMSDYFRQALEERRQRPRKDLISDLIAAEIDGTRLDESELLGFCILLLVAGNITTTYLLGSALICLDENPEAMEQLRANPALVPEAVEEVLRYRSPVQGMFRVVGTDTVLRGHQLRAGQGVMAWIGSANRDEAQFPDPDRFDITRNPNRHMGFGKGIHFCLGAPLARLEARIALSVMLERTQEIQVLPGTRLEPIDSSFLYGVKRLPIAFR